LGRAFGAVRTGQANQGREMSARRLAPDTDAAGMQADGAVACDFAVSDPTPVNGDGG